MNLIVIFFLFAYFGCLCLSGGSSLLQFYIDELVVARQWMTLEGLGNLMAISQVTPGPIGVNLATFLGYTQGGFWGGLLATVGLLTPSYILMSLAVKSYTKWHDSRFVRSLMYTLKPMTLALVATALFAALGMSVFTDQIPFDYWAGMVEKYEGNFGICCEMTPLFIFAIVALWKKKLSIMSVIFISAGIGAAIAAVMGPASA